MTEEIWKAVVGFEGAYEVSNLGRVRSLDRYVDQPSGKGPNRTYRRFMEGRLLRPQRHSKGYLQVALSTQLYLVQWIVAAAFIGPRPTGALVLHDDDDKKNNAASNLRYDSYAENAVDMSAHGRSMIGEANPFHKLEQADVVSIRGAYERGAQQRDLATQFGVSQGHISRLVNSEQWRHVI